MATHRRRLVTDEAGLHYGFTIPATLHVTVGVAEPPTTAERRK
jgi:hypothetical protein